MKILVTGHKGFIGQNFIKACPATWDISTYDWVDRPWGYESLAKVKDMDWVVHFGAISSTTETDVKKVMDQNLTYSILLFEECKKYDVNFQWSSSASVYGNKTTNFKETTHCSPANLYGKSKYLLEQYIKNSEKLPDFAYDDYKSKFVIQGFRYFNVFGPGEDHKGDQASPIHKFTQQAINDGVIKVFKNSEYMKRDFVPVEKIIDTHLRMMKCNKSGIWNVGTGNAISFMEIAQKIAEKYNAKIEEIPFPDNLKNHYQRYTCSDTDLLDRTLRSLQTSELLDSI